MSGLLFFVMCSACPLYRCSQKIICSHFSLESFLLGLAYSKHSKNVLTLCHWIWDAEHLHQGSNWYTSEHPSGLTKLSQYFTIKYWMRARLSGQLVLHGLPLSLYKPQTNSSRWKTSAYLLKHPIPQELSVQPQAQLQLNGLKKRKKKKKAYSSRKNELTGRCQKALKRFFKCHISNPAFNGDCMQLFFMFSYIKQTTSEIQQLIRKIKEVRCFVRAMLKYCIWAKTPAKFSPIDLKRNRLYFCI